MWSAEREELFGTYLPGGLRVGTLIGLGGTGAVLEAETASGHALALKVLRPAFAHDPAHARRLRREAEVARTVTHEGIVGCCGEGTLPDGSPYVAMERLRGESLAQLLKRRGRVDGSATAAIALALCRSLAAVHRSGFVHRDVKPEHVVLSKRQNGLLRVQLIDFGVCYARSASESERLAERGRVFGTPFYVSPEQAAGALSIDGRADMFSLGVTMFEALTGRVPFSGSTTQVVLKRIISEDAPSISLQCADVGPALAQVVGKALARDREQRFATMDDMARELSRSVPNLLATERRLAASLELVSPWSDLGVVSDDETIDTAVAAA